MNVSSRDALRARSDEQPVRAPLPVPASSWVLPDPAHADQDGVVGIGADLSPPTLVDAYRRGIFPWPHPKAPLPWFSPDPRGLLRLDAVKLSRSLRARLRNSGWHTTVDAAFDQVILACSRRRDDDGTWIIPAMVRAYRRLAELGWAHSVEVWDGSELVGGLYGVQLGAVFTGESMFHHQRDASKVALVDLAARLAAAGGAFVDVQLRTEHLTTLGVVDVPREVYVEELAAARDRLALLDASRRPVSRLADWRPANTEGWVSGSPRMRE